MSDERDRVLTGRQGSANSFIELGKVLVYDPDSKVTIREGQIFEAPTVKGGKNLIVAMRVRDGYMVYIHGDRAKKVQADIFLRAVINGDIEPKLPLEVDAGRMSMAMIGIDAIANRRTAEETIDSVELEAFERHKREQGS